MGDFTPTTVCRAARGNRGSRYGMKAAAGISLLVIAALILAGCAYKGPKTEPGGSTTLTNTYWKLIAMDEVDYEPVDTKREAHLILRPDHRITGFGGCNNFSGSWLMEDERLVIGPLLSTRMACPDMDSERVLLSALDGAVGTDIMGEILTISGTDGTELRFRAMYFQ